MINKRCMGSELSLNNILWGSVCPIFNTFKHSISSGVHQFPRVVCLPSTAADCDLCHPRAGWAQHMHCTTSCIAFQSALHCIQGTLYCKVHFTKCSLKYILTAALRAHCAACSVAAYSLRCVITALNSHCAACSLLCVLASLRDDCTAFSLRCVLTALHARCAA